MKPILCVLAGGRSSRFGSSKLAIRIEGRPILKWIADRLAEVVAPQRWLSVAPGQTSADSAPPGAGAFQRVVIDPPGRGGPLVAMAQVLRCMPARSLALFVASDAPLVDVAWVGSLVRLCQAGGEGVTAAMNRWSGGPQRGRIEPFPSVWRCGAGYRLVRAALEAGLRGPHELAARREVVTATLAWPSHQHLAVNVNRREDLDLLHQLTAFDVTVIP